MKMGSYEEVATRWAENRIKKDKTSLALSGGLFFGSVATWVVWLVRAISGEPTNALFYAFFAINILSMYYTWMVRAEIKKTGEEVFGYETMSLFNSLFVVFLTLLCFILMIASNNPLVRGALGLLMLVGLGATSIDTAKLLFDEIEEIDEAMAESRKERKEEKEKEEKRKMEAAKLQDALAIKMGFPATNVARMIMKNRSAT